MELFIQMGHNMQALALEHLEEFDGGTIIISPSRRAVWYYCPQALSEYKFLF